MVKHKLLYCCLRGEDNCLFLRRDSVISTPLLPAHNHVAPEDHNFHIIRVHVNNLQKFDLISSNMFCEAVSLSLAIIAVTVLLVPLLFLPAWSEILN